MPLILQERYVCTSRCKSTLFAILTCYRSSNRATNPIAPRYTLMRRRRTVISSSNPVLVHLLLHAQSIPIHAQKISLRDLSDPLICYFPTFPAKSKTSCNPRGLFSPTDSAEDPLILNVGYGFNCCRQQRPAPGQYTHHWAASDGGYMASDLPFSGLP